MKHLNNKKIAIHYSSSADQFGMDLIKSTKQFPNYYHKGKKMLLNGECDTIWFVPSAKSGIKDVFVATINSVKKMYNYSMLNPLWTISKGHKDDSNWDMLVELGAVVKTSIEDMEAKGYPTKGIQGGIKYVTR